MVLLKKDGTLHTMTVEEKREFVRERNRVTCIACIIVFSAAFAAFAYALYNM